MRQSIAISPDGYPALTYPQMLREQARHRPHRVAMRQKDLGIWKPASWRTYYQRACHIGLGLAALGLEPGGHVGIISETRFEWVLTQLGCSLVGAVAVGVYPTNPVGEAAYVLGHSDADFVVCEDQEQLDKVLAALDRLPRIRKIIVIERKGLRNTPAKYRGRLMIFADLEALGKEYEAVHPTLIDDCLARQSMNDVAVMVYTSGSTGKPKGAMISYRNIRSVMPGLAECFGMSADFRTLSYLPLCHIAEQLFTIFLPIYVGMKVSFGESIRTVQEDLREVGPMFFFGVPRIWEKLHASIHIKISETGRLRRWIYRKAVAACEPFADKDSTQRSLRENLIYWFWYWLIFRALLNFTGLREARIALTGAAPIPPAIVRFFRTIGVPLVESYGLTENTGCVFFQRRTSARNGYVGEPLAVVEARIAEDGELLVRGDPVFVGYYKEPEATADAIRDRWLHTGDVVEEDGGQYRIIDRKKDFMITSGGKNLTPSEIENRMKASPFIKQCLVVADRRRFVSALVEIDYETVGKWAEQQRIAFTHFRSLAEHPRVRELIAAEIDRGNRELAQVAQVKKFHLLTKELDHDDGELTATMKVRRIGIHKANAAEIEAMYA